MPSARDGRMEHLQKILDKAEKERKEDAEKFIQLNDRTCQVCGSEGSDRRSLLINNGYNLKEVSDKFISLWYVDTVKDLDTFWYMRICKGCRGALMTKLNEWIQEKGRLKHGNLDDDGILSFGSVE